MAFSGSDNMPALAGVVVRSEVARRSFWLGVRYPAATPRPQQFFTRLASETSCHAMRARVCAFCLRLRPAAGAMPSSARL